MIIHAHLRQRSTGQRDAPEPEHRSTEVEAATFDAGRDRITAELPEG